ncbi:MAG: NADH-quinone oxidoreductase subunit I [Planctomycetes bacterium]|nr:NADH-quinone oxidoreductase subunit I [Planctomycetota bacterium]
MLSYVKNIVDTVKTTVKGMQVTLRNLRRPEITVCYPEQLLPLPKGYRGIHTLDQEACIYCFQCAKICPVECIEMKADRVEKKFLAWEQFSIDYNKCIFCNLCTEVCPKDCIHMDRRDGSAKFALVTDDRSTLNLDILTYVGLSENDDANVKKIVADRAAGITTPPAAPAAAKPAAPGAAPAAAPAAAAKPAVAPAAPPAASAPATPPAAAVPPKPPAPPAPPTPPPTVV